MQFRTFWVIGIMFAASRDSPPQVSHTSVLQAFLDDAKFLSVPPQWAHAVDIASRLTLQIAARFSATRALFRHPGGTGVAVTQLSGNHASRRECTRGKYFYNTANGPLSPNGFSTVHRPYFDLGQQPCAIATAAELPFRPQPPRCHPLTPGSPG